MYLDQPIDFRASATTITEVSAQWKLMTCGVGLIEVEGRRRKENQQSRDEDVRTHILKGSVRVKSHVSASSWAASNNRAKGLVPRKWSTGRTCQNRVGVTTALDKKYETYR